MGAFKTQQHRWAQGSIQTAVKVLPAILRSDLPLRVKTEAVFHLTANFGYVLTVLLAALVGPAVWLRRRIGIGQIAIVDLPLILVSIVSISAFYLVAQREAYGRWRDAVKYVPALMAVGIGISLNNARAVLAGLGRGDTEFRRTPKYAISGSEPRALRTRRYRARRGLDTWVELAAGIYFAGLVVAAAFRGDLWGAVPFLALFAGGFLYTAILTMRQTGAPSPSARSLRPRLDVHLGPPRKRVRVPLGDDERVGTREGQHVAAARG